MKTLGRWRVSGLAFAAVWVIFLSHVSLVQAQEQQAEHFQKTFAVSPGATLNVENYKARFMSQQLTETR